MKYAIISDIHSNLQALRAVIYDIKASHCDEIICLGDVVGYGPQPAETLAFAYSKVQHFVIGNHDAVIANRMSTENFSAPAQRAIEWTRQHLDQKAVDFFTQLPYELAFEGFRCTHGSYVMPERFGYVFDSNEAFANFCVTQEQLLFIGHSHIPGLFLHAPHIQREPIWCEPCDFTIEYNARYLINVGSVGYARDKDFRACYCILDTEKKTVQFRRVPFDVDQFREEVQKAGLVENKSFSHLNDDSDEQPLIDFSPQNAPSNSKQHIETVSTPLPTMPVAQKMNDLMLKKRRIRQLNMLALLCLIIIIILGLYYLLFYANQMRTKPIKNIYSNLKIEDDPISVSTNDTAWDLPISPITMAAIEISQLDTALKNTPTTTDTAKKINGHGHLRPRPNPQPIPIVVEPPKPILDSEVKIPSYFIPENAKLFNPISYKKMIYGTAEPFNVGSKNSFSLLNAKTWDSVGILSDELNNFPFTLGLNENDISEIELTQDRSGQNYQIHFNFNTQSPFYFQTHPVVLDWTKKQKLLVELTPDEQSEVQVFVLYELPNKRLYTVEIPISVQALSNLYILRLPVSNSKFVLSDYKMSVLIIGKTKTLSINEIKIAPR